MFDLHYETQKERIQERLDSFDIISITTDMWSAKYQKKKLWWFHNTYPRYEFENFLIKISHSAENIDRFIKSKLVNLLIWDRVFFLSRRQSKRYAQIFERYEKRLFLLF